MRTCPSRRSAVALTLVALAIATSVSAGPVLQTEGSSLTNYRPGTTTTKVQGVLPGFEQRGSTLEGSIRGGYHGYAPAPVTYEPEECKPLLMSGTLDLMSLTYSAQEVDIFIPTDGPPIYVGRTYNQRQGATTKQSSFGKQGSNWFQTAQPEIVVVAASGSDPAMVYLVTGANQFFEFKQSASGLYVGVNGNGAVVQYDGTGTYQTYTIYDHAGTRMVFWGTNTAGNKADGQLWKVIDVAGREAYVGDKSSHSSAVTNGYDSEGGITVLYQEYGTASEERRYTFTYGQSALSDGVKTRDALTQVKVETKTSGTWASPTNLTEISKVDYTYYTSTNSTGNQNYFDGNAGDLKTVTVTRPLTDSGVSDARTKYYRYYKTYNGADDHSKGHAHNIRLIIGYEGYRRAGVALSPNPVTGEKNSDLKRYAEAYFEYESDANEQRVAAAFFNGECGCGSGVNGLYTFSQDTNTAGGAPDQTDKTYQTGWKTRTIILQPDGTYVTKYMDETGQALSTAVTNTTPTGSPSERWVTGIVRDSDGRITEVHSPANLSSYTHSSGAITYSNSAGLVTLYTRMTSGDDADLAGLVKAVRYQEGTTGSAYYLSQTLYTKRAFDVSTIQTVKPLITEQRSYVNATTSAGTATDYEKVVYSYDYWWHGTSSITEYMALKQMTTTYTAVDSSTKNGENAAATTITYLRKDGRPAFVKGRDGVYSAMTYNNLGLVVKSIQDASSSSGGYDTNYTPSVFGFTNSGTLLQYTTQYAYDAIGRVTTTTLPSARVMASYYTKIGDGRLATLSFPRVSGSTYYGPVSYSVSNHAGRGELQTTLGLASVATGTLAITSWVNEGTSDPLDALHSTFTGTNRVNVFRLGTSILDDSGTKVTESRQYTSIITSGAWAGSSGTNYDATAFVYDSMGRVNKVTDPTATITRTVFDTLGRTSARWIGTDDTSFSASGVGAPNNMVQVEKLEYDGTAVDANSYLTKRYAFVQPGTNGVGDSGTQRVTEYKYDVRGNAIVILNPESPHVVNKYDVRRRVTETAAYSSTSGLTISTLPGTGTSTRRTYAQSFFDERGQVYKTTRHKVIQPNESGTTGDSSDSLDTLYWYDAAGRGIKEGGERNSKRFYDHLGRVTHQFELARNNDTTYAHALDVSGDVVLEESQTVYDDADKTGNVVVQATISRHHTDTTTTTGALDSNGDSNRYKFTAANLAGRIQITSMWYDDLDRTTEIVAYGDNGGSDFDRRPSNAWASVPSRSSTALRSSTVYNDNGTVQQVQAPRERSAGSPIATKLLYDAAGRTVVEIRNYTGGSTSNANRDNDLYTRYAYTNGLMTAMWVDLKANDTDGKVPLGGDATSPDDDDDQITEYVYGQNKGTGAADSKIASNRMLKQVKYPPASGGASEASRSQYFAYNEQGQKIYQKDQNATERAFVYDNAGRQTHDRVTTAGGSVDSAVLRVSTTYEDRGMVQLVTQYNNATVGSGSITDEVKYTYDGWGNLQTYQEDRDSAVGVSTTNDYGVVYAYSKVNDTGTVGGTKRRSGVRRTSSKLQYAGTDKQQINYAYDSSGSLLDDDAGRVTRLTLGASSPPDVAEYRYLGAGRVIDTKLSEPSLVNRLHDGSSPAVYTNYLDRFNRVASSRWVKSSGTYYRVDLSYDDNSNITLAEDKWVKSWSVQYTMDNLDRVTRANYGLYTGSITTYLDEQWTISSTPYLSQTGNWTRYKRDRGPSNEADETMTFNQVNQVTLRDVDGGGSSTGNYTPVYDNAGNLTDDDGRTPPATYTYGYTYTYDAWNRLRKVFQQDATTLVEEFSYNGLGHRIGWQYDINADKTVDGSDAWVYFAYNERWQQVAVYLGTATSPKETYVYHEAGFDGRGGSSYIDSVVLRDRDTDANGSREERYYYLQNWRYDVVMLVKPSSYMVERYRYNAYGRPESYAPADIARTSDSAAVPDDALTTQDSNAFNTAYGIGTATFQSDFVGLSGASGPDGSVTFDDYLEFYSANLFYTSVNGGVGLVSDATVDNRKGYAGYEFDTVLAGAGGATSHARYHVRNRVLDSNTGKWTQEDPIEYADGLNLYEYCHNRPIIGYDTFGLADAFECCFYCRRNSLWAKKRWCLWAPLPRHVRPPMGIYISPCCLSSGSAFCWCIYVTPLLIANCYSMQTAIFTVCINIEFRNAAQRPDIMMPVLAAGACTAPISIANIQTGVLEYGSGSTYCSGCGSR